MADDENYGDDEEQGYGDDQQDEQQYGGDEQQYGGDEEQQQEEQQYGGGDDEEQQQEEQQQEQQDDEYKDDEQQAAQMDYGNAEMPASIEAACSDLYSDTPSFNWFTTKLVDAKLKTAELKLDRVGKGGLPEIKQYLANEGANIIFFLLRVNTYDNENSVRAKFIYGRFVGTGVKFMQKAKLTPNLGAIADKFPVKHLSKDCDEELKDWEIEKLSKEFLRIGGAHKPSRYEYGPNAVYNVKK